VQHGTNGLLYFIYILCVIIEHKQLPGIFESEIDCNLNNCMVWLFICRHTVYFLSIISDLAEQQRFSDPADDHHSTVRIKDLYLWYILWLMYFQFFKIWMFVWNVLCLKWRLQIELNDDILAWIQKYSICKTYVYILLFIFCVC
jgi:hypothetical protein